MLHRLTIINVGTGALLIIISSYSIYSSACFLVEQFPTASEEKQLIFNEQLASLLWWISSVIIITGAFIYYFFTKRMLSPLHELVKSTNDLSKGNYPPIIKKTSFREIDQLTMHFNELNIRLRKNEESRNIMLADMAHELRTPLSNINGYLEAMRDGVIQGEQPLYGSLHKESERLISMVNQLSEMSKWNEISSHSIIDKETMDIKAVLDESIALFRLKLQHKHIPFLLEVTSQKILLNKDGIQQAVTNLLQNAIEYYDGNTPIELKGFINNDMYEIRVTSPGHSIPDKDREWLFERFYRVDASRDRKTGGTGLGLAIVKEIVVTQHSGSVNVNSVGNIHTFTLALPLK